MTEQEAQALIQQGDTIDTAAATHAEEAIGGGQLVQANPDKAAMEWFIVPKTLAWAITAFFPELAPVYTDEKCMALAREIVPVAQKYGLDGPGDNPELSLIAATAMFAAPAYLAHKARKAEKAQEPPKEEGKPDGS